MYTYDGTRFKVRAGGKQSVYWSWDDSFVVSTRQEGTEAAATGGQISLSARGTRELSACVRKKINEDEQRDENIYARLACADTVRAAMDDRTDRIMSMDPYKKCR